MKLGIYMRTYMDDAPLALMAMSGLVNIDITPKPSYFVLEVRRGHYDCVVGFLDSALSNMARDCRVIIAESLFEYQIDYLGQQFDKMLGARLMPADCTHMMFLDSDCYPRRAEIDLITESYLSADFSKILQFQRPWEEAGGAICWRKPTARILGVEPTHERMTRFPFLYRTEDLITFSLWLFRRAQINPYNAGTKEEQEEDVIDLYGWLQDTAKGNFSEFNLINSWIAQVAHEHVRRQYEFLHPSERSNKDWQQDWSHQNKVLINMPSAEIMERNYRFCKNRAKTRTVI